MKNKKSKHELRANTIPALITVAKYDEMWTKLKQ